MCDEARRKITPITCITDIDHAIEVMQGRNQKRQVKIIRMADLARRTQSELVEIAQKRGLIVNDGPYRNVGRRQLLMAIYYHATKYGYI